jgi:hypothetical protein
MFGSAHDGERAAAALKADQHLRARGLRWCEMAEVVLKSGKASAWERDFCNNLLAGWFGDQRETIHDARRHFLEMRTLKRAGFAGRRAKRYKRRAAHFPEAAPMASHPPSFDDIEIRRILAAGKASRKPLGLSIAPDGALLAHLVSPSLKLEAIRPFVETSAVGLGRLLGRRRI